MCDHKGGSSFCQSFHGLLDNFLALIVKGGSGFIKNQYGRILQKYPCNGQSLFLASGQFYASLPNICQIAIRQLFNKLMGIGQLCRPDHFFICSIRPSVTDILHHVLCKQIYVLLDDPDLFAQVLQLNFPDIRSIQQDPSGIHIVKTWDQAAQRGLSST